MRVLIACEESQRVCIEFRKKGHEAYSCDMIECSGGHPEWHIKGDVIPLLHTPCLFVTMDYQFHDVNKWDMIIAFPPCTYLTNAAACRLYPTKGVLDQERYMKGLEAKEFFLRFLNADCEKVAIENPVSSKIFQMPQSQQEIQPYEFDEFGQHPYTKKTRLWLKGLPLLRPTTPEEVPVSPYCPSGTGRKIREKLGAAKRGDDAKERSKTFIGIAKAMADQWG